MHRLIHQISLSQMTRQLFKAELTSISSINSIKNYSDYGSNASRKDRKRFYKNVSICETGDSKSKSYEIVLDKRKLKSPGGKPFNVKSELLAGMCANEWDAQKDAIKLGTMHLTSLINTCLDNPNKFTKQDIVASLMEYLQTDTVLFFDCDGNEESKKLEFLQEQKWRPVVDWFNEKFPDMNLKISHDISGAMVDSFDPNSTNSFEKYLNSNFDFNSLIAFNYIAESLKSVILTVALLERFVPSVNEACILTNLEQFHQYDQWGKVEWYHEVNETELCSRVSSAVCMIYLSEDSKYFLHKTKVNI